MRQRRRRGGKLKGGTGEHDIRQWSVVCLSFNLRPVRANKSCASNDGSMPVLYRYYQFKITDTIGVSTQTITVISTSTLIRLSTGTRRRRYSVCFVPRSVPNRHPTYLNRGTVAIQEFRRTVELFLPTTKDFVSEEPQYAMQNSATNFLSDESGAECNSVHPPFS